MTKIYFYKDKDFDGCNVGIFEQKNGEFLAITFSVSKTFKTLRGAINFMQKRGFNMGVVS